MSAPKLYQFTTAFAALALVTGCQTVESGLASGTVGEIPKNARETRGTTANESALDGLSIRETLLGQGKDENQLPVNKYLWRASLDVLSFLPLDTVDTFSGVISTDWGAAQGATNERVRATAYVRDRELSANSLTVSVFRETLSPTGVWQTAIVSPATAEQLKDAILTRARQLRIEDVDG